MGQDAIWDHFQNEGIESFGGAYPRLHYLVHRLQPNERVLNIGIGSGAFEQIAIERKIEIWSLDPSERAVLALRERLGIGERAQQGRSQSLPFESDQFDAVVMSEVLEHLDDSIRDQSLAEVHRVLKTGGRLIGTVPARERLEDSHVVCPNCEHHFHRWGHEAAFDSQSINFALSKYFEVERAEERFFNEWHSAPLRRRIGGLVKKFLSWHGLGTYGTARNIFFVARKSD